jgi:hypothetical protein
VFTALLLFESIYHSQRYINVQEHISKVSPCKYDHIKYPKVKGILNFKNKYVFSSKKEISKINMAFSSKKGKKGVSL